MRARTFTRMPQQLCGSETKERRQEEAVSRQGKRYKIEKEKRKLITRVSQEASFIFLFVYRCWVFVSLLYATKCISFSSCGFVVWHISGCERDLILFSFEHSLKWTVISMRETYVRISLSYLPVLEALKCLMVITCFSRNFRKRSFSFFSICLRYFLRYDCARRRRK